MSLILSEAAAKRVRSRRTPHRRQEVLRLRDGFAVASLRTRVAFDSTAAAYFSRYPVIAATTLATTNTPMMQAMKPTM